ncbi:MAG: c-type cytochrome [Hyphomicrobiaceae bacterium]|nr:c-type cytochrome [Hyphomicrobiaceae bacterium]
MKSVSRLLLAVLAAGLVIASGTGSVAEDVADLELGRNVAMGQRALSAPRSACMSCHGLSGAADSSGSFPRLSGQAAWYLYKQLKDYASGARPNDVMSPIARTLTDAQMQAVAAYYAGQSAPAPDKSRKSDPLELQRGAAMASIGMPDKGVAACVNCHGPGNRGLPPSFPYLAGQSASYTQLQLQLWKDGVRKNDPLGVMQHIAKQLSGDEIGALALYLSSLDPPQRSTSE